MLASISDCVDLEAQLASFFAADPSLSGDQAACVAESYVNSDVFPEALFSTEPDSALDARVSDELASAYQSCG